MKIRNIIFLASIMLFVIGLAMLTTIPVAFFLDSAAVVNGMGYSAGICLLISLIGTLISVRRNKSISAHAALCSGFASVLLAWLLAVVCGALPFVLCCEKFTFVNALFETASGFSTTGCTIIESSMFEGLPRSILYWRSLLNWLGGVGFVMFVLILLPSLSGGRMLFNAEVPGLKSAGEQLTERVKSTAWMTIVLYVGLTIAATVAYRCLGMGSWFDAVCHACSTIATGGFSTYGDSFAHYSAPALQWAAIFFMYIASVNFALSLCVFYKGKFNFYRDEEYLLYTSFFIVFSLLFACKMVSEDVVLRSLSGEVLESSGVLGRVEVCLRTSAFQVISIMSTTGFGTSDYTHWGLSCVPAIILMLTLLGGCTGSTAGGLKFARFLVVLKQSRGEISRKLFPHLVQNVRINGERQEVSVVRQSMGFFVIYICVITASTLILPFLCDMDLETSLSAVITCISNVGPGLGKVSPSSDFNWMAPGAKILLSILMVTGRLELYTVLVIFLPRFWRCNSK